MVKAILRSKKTDSKAENLSKDYSIIFSPKTRLLYVLKFLPLYLVWFALVNYLPEQYSTPFIVLTIATYVVWLMRRKSGRDVIMALGIPLVVASVLFYGIFRGPDVVGFDFENPPLWLFLIIIFIIIPTVITFVFIKLVTYFERSKKS